MVMIFVHNVNWKFTYAIRMSVASQTLFVGSFSLPHLKPTWHCVTPSAHP